ncbi:cysteine desulfurase family protein [Alloacidobacterium sp.]|uniref:cysteine desulfurase family protein n=1 Tax=Alloacidobacterium sp. TaxID=2951999 RepID=UPI002D6F279F|nr:cysteine desulfurase family protein [Alloacidobacterium sp.]HYK36319.1 cysteine desulfurase family protein [Alloacidobacterium sp.]
MKRVYMDANATTPLLPEVLDAMRPYFIEHFGNASSIHQQGQQARAAVEQARESVAALINCRAAEIVFTSGGTESDNLALFGLVQPGDHLITSSIEHHAVLHAAEKLRERGIEVTFLPVSGDGVINPQDLRRAIQDNTKLISIMMANNETGAIQPVSEIGRIAAEADIYFHTDAVQAAGKLPIDVQSLRCDLLSISGHKMHAPQGTGILYVRKGTQLEPLFFGGSHERQRRAGTENLPGIVGLGKAAEIARVALTDGTVEKIAALRNRLEQGILSQVEDTGVNGGSVRRVPNTTNIYFDNLEGEALVIALDLKGLCTSGGSACASGAAEPSHVLSAMALAQPRARASLRFSLTKLSTDEDVDFALEVIPVAASRLRELAPVNAGTLG